MNIAPHAIGVGATHLSTPAERALALGARIGAAPLCFDLPAPGGLGPALPHVPEQEADECAR